MSTQRRLGATTVQHAWTAATDNVGVTAYELYRSTDGGPFSLIAEPANPTYTDPGLTANTAYRYYLKARDAAGNTSWRIGYKNITTGDDGGPGGLPAPDLVRVTRIESPKLVINYSKVPGAANHEVLVNGQVTATDNDSWYVTANLTPSDHVPNRSPRNRSQRHPEPQPQFRQQPPHNGPPSTL